MRYEGSLWRTMSKTGCTWPLGLAKLELLQWARWPWWDPGPRAISWTLRRGSQRLRLRLYLSGDWVWFRHLSLCLYNPKRPANQTIGEYTVWRGFRFHEAERIQFTNQEDSIYTTSSRNSGEDLYEHKHPDQVGIHNSCQSAYYTTYVRLIWAWGIYNTGSEMCPEQNHLELPW